MTEQVFIAKYYAECNRLPWLGPGQKNIALYIQHCLIQTQLGPTVFYLVLFSSYRSPLDSGRWSSQRILVTRTKIPWESGQLWPGHHTSDRSYSREFIIRLFDSRKVILLHQSLLTRLSTRDDSTWGLVVLHTNSLANGWDALFWVPKILPVFLSGGNCRTFWELPHCQSFPQSSDHRHLRVGVKKIVKW